MSAGFTPGPWEAITDGDVPDVVFNGGKDSIFYVNGEEGNANARLIAAAPALYEALANMVECVAKRGGTWDELLGSSEQCEQVNDAMTALKLARGEA